MDRSFEAAVAVDSGALLEERSRLSEPQRREAIEKLDEVMEERRAGYAAVMPETAIHVQVDPSPFPTVTPCHT